MAAGLCHGIVVLLGLSSLVLVQGQNSGDLRLNSTTNGSSSGRLEFYYNGRWGTVCINGFDSIGGRVACRQLGFADVINYGKASELLNFNPGNSLFTRIWLDNVRCRGTETKLIYCPHNGYGVHDCSHAEDVGLECRPVIEGSPLRLQGGGSSYGRLEVYHNGKWGTVCDDRFSQADANVACRQLGFSRGYCWGSVSAFGVPQASSNVPVWLNNLQCTSTDTSLINCPRIMGIKNCTHVEDVAVVCRSRSSCNGLERDNDGGAGSRGNTSIFSGAGGTVGFLIFFGIIGCILYSIFRGKGSKSRSRPRPRPNTNGSRHLSSNSPSWSPPLKKSVIIQVHKITISARDTAYPLEN